jgi:serine/threonine-protein kinase RsbW
VTSADSSDEVRLSLPAVPEYARIVRLTTAGLASRLGFSYDEVEDLRIAVGEACTHLLGNDGHQGTLDVTYRLQADTITIEAVSEGAGGGDRGEGLPALSEQILGAVVDDHDISDQRVFLVKRRTT